MNSITINKLNAQTGNYGPYYAAECTDAERDALVAYLEAHPIEKGNVPFEYTISGNGTSHVGYSVFSDLLGYLNAAHKGNTPPPISTTSNNQQ